MNTTFLESNDPELEDSFNYPIKTKFGNARVGCNGYYEITSRKEGNNGKKLHRLIYEDYFGEIPNKCFIHHIDGNKTNNDIKNLQCISDSFHKFLHNKKYHWLRGVSGETHPRFGIKHTKKTRNKMSKSHKGVEVGEKNPRAILTEKDVIKIRQLRKEGKSPSKVFKKLEKSLGIRFGTFESVWYNKNWKHVVV